MNQSSAAMFSAPRSKASKRDQSAPRQLSTLVIAISLLAGGSGGFLISRVLQHVESLQERIATLEDALERTTTEAAIATEDAREATQLAEAADSFREQAESELTQIQTQALRADQRAALAVAFAAFDARIRRRQVNGGIIAAQRLHVGHQVVWLVAAGLGASCPR